MKKFLTALIVLAVLAFSPAAHALDLHEARHAGIVGETAGGYIAARENTPEAKVLVADVNARRRQEYARISKKNNQPVDVVAKLAAGQIINQLDPGDYYQDEKGVWKTR